MIQVCLYKMSDPEGELLKLGCDRLSAALSASQARHLTLKLRESPRTGLCSSSGRLSPWERRRRCPKKLPGWGRSR